MIDLNNATEFGGNDDVKIFNGGNAGVVGGVSIRVEKKPADDVTKSPDYKLFVSDGNGEINEGFWYQDNMEQFKKFQGQKLISLGKGVLGEDFKFPSNWSTLKEVLDGVMMLVAKGSKGQTFKISVSYGTNKRPEIYLRMKAFGSFIQNESMEYKVPLANGVDDLLVRPQSDQEKKDEPNDPFASIPPASGSGENIWG